MIDEASLAIEYRIISTEDGYLPAAVQASPLVSQQGGSTYVYFTCNTTPGGVYRYRVGDKQAELIYTPAEGQQNYCMASVVCGSDGTLYYINDSGNLFAIKGASSSLGDGGDTPEKEPNESDKVPGNTGTVSENGDDGAAGRRPAGPYPLRSSLSLQAMEMLQPPMAKRLRALPPMVLMPKSRLRLRPGRRARLPLMRQPSAACPLGCLPRASSLAFAV